MKSIKENCIEFLQNEDIRKDMKEMIHPIVQIVYNEVYVYLWVICFYCVFMFFLLLASVFLQIRLIAKHNAAIT
jgi:hypothetical protein